MARASSRDVIGGGDRRRGRSCLKELRGQALQYLADILGRIVRREYHTAEAAAQRSRQKVNLFLREP